VAIKPSRSFVLRLRTDRKRLIGPESFWPGCCCLFVEHGPAISTLRVLYSIKSERLPCELDYNLLIRWFAGLSITEPIRDNSAFALGARDVTSYYQLYCQRSGGVDKRGDVNSRKNRKLLIVKSLRFGQKPFEGSNPSLPPIQ
jgi:hypothetical protein